MLIVPPSFRGIHLDAASIVIGAFAEIKTESLDSNGSVEGTITSCRLGRLAVGVAVHDRRRKFPKSEEIRDQRFHVVLLEIRGQGRACPAVGPLAPRAFPSAGDEQGGLETELVSLLVRKGVIASAESRVARDEHALVDSVRVVKHDPIGVEHRDFLQLANGERLDFGKAPTVGQTQDGCPYFHRRVVQRVFSAKRELQLSHRTRAREGKDTRIVKDPEQPLKVGACDVVEDQRRGLRSAFCLLPRRCWGR